MKRWDLPTGVFDSGIGGLTVVREIRRQLPHEDLIYLGDTARVPYGTKSPETVIRFACEDAQFLVRRGVKAIAVACNTASAWALPELERRFSVPIFGVILPGVRAALERSRTQRIGIIGTSATIRSGAYTDALLAGSSRVKTFARACPLLVPLVEEGWLRRTVTRAVLKTYLAPLRRQRIDTLILGCTHYPLLKPLIAQILGKDIALVDSADSCARDIRERLGCAALLAAGRRRAGTIQPFLTDDAGRFGEMAERFLGGPTLAPVKVDLAPLTAG